MHSEIQILGRTIPLYGVMIAAGLLAGGFASIILVRRHKLSTDYLLLTLAYAIGLGLIGAKLLYLFVIRDYINWQRVAEPAYFTMLMQGGFVYYGGFIGGVSGALLAGRIHKYRVLPYLCVAIPGLPLAHAFGRIGCFFAGCCYGFPYSGPFCVTYSASAGAPLGQPLFPVQLLESALNFILAALLIVYVIKKGAAAMTPILYTLAYGLMRFVLEYFRYDDAERVFFGPFSTSQWISLLLVLLCAMMTLAGRKYRSQYVADAKSE